MTQTDNLGRVDLFAAGAGKKIWQREILYCQNETAVLSSLLLLWKLYEPPYFFFLQVLRNHIWAYCRLWVRFFSGIDAAQSLR